MLAGDTLVSDSAWYDSAGTIDMSIRCMLASSTVGSASSTSAESSGAVTPTSSSVAPLSATSTSTDDTSPASSSVVTPQAAGDVVSFRLETEDTSNQAITSIAVDQDFQLAVFVKDVRDPAVTNAGVFSAYMNIDYTAALASISASPGLVFDSFFPVQKTGDLSTDGHIVGAGAASGSIVPPGSAEQLLFRVTVHADAVGVLSFTSSFDTIGGHDTGLYSLSAIVQPDEIEFGQADIQILVEHTPTIAISDVNAAEGTSAQNTPYVFTVTLSEATSSEVTVGYSTGGGSATAGTDYLSTSGVLTFAPGITEQFITVSVVADALDEPDEETFNVTLANPVNATLDDAVGLGTINDDDATPTLSVNSVSKFEGDEGTTDFVFTVSLSAASGRVVTVAYATSDATGGATEGDDYVGTSATITLTPGAISQLVTVSVNGDTVNEPNEAFTLQLSDPTNATLSTAPDQGIGTILNDDGPHITFTSLEVTHPEGNAGDTAFVFTVDIGVTDSENVTVAYATGGGNATPGEDYTAASGTLTFSPGTTTQDITVLVHGDTVSELNETFQVVLSNPTNATLVDTTATGVIQNDDEVLLSFADDTVSVTEPDSGTTQMFFTVNLSGQSQQTVTVQYDLVPGTNLIPGTDFVNTSGTLTFAPSDTSKIITVVVNGDVLSEADEQFTVRLFNSTNAGNAESVAQAVTATGTIVDNDPLPTLSLGDAVVELEGNAGTDTPFVFTVSLSAASGQTALVAFQTHDEFATTADNDYSAVSGTLTFAPGVTQQFITVMVHGDAKYELSERFSVTLTQIGETYDLGSALAYGNIDNDDQPPLLTINDVSHQEGNSGTTDYVFTVTLTGPTSETATVNYATAPGANSPAASGTDFVGQNGVLTFAPGDTQMFITVAVNGDTLNEGDETFALNLTAPGNARFAGAVQSISATGTILNDDGLPTLSISDVTQVEGDSGTTAYVFVVTLNALSGQSVTVAYATADGTATAPNDYVATSGTLTFGPGVSTQNLTVNVVGDLFQEPDETFVVNLSNATGATISDAQGVGTIQNGNDTLVVIPSSISGIAFVDANQNKLHETLEYGLTGVSVILSGTSSISGDLVSQQTTTAADGSYSFTNLDPGDYKVSFVQPTNYLTGSVVLGSAGGQLLSGTSEIGFTNSYAAPGGITGSGYNFLVRGLRPEMISQRLFLASTTQTSPPATNVSVAISSATSPVNSSNVNNSSASGTGEANAALSLVVSDGTHTATAQTTIGSGGTWSITGLNLAGLDDGTIVYKATATNGSGNSAIATTTGTKDTVAPSVVVSTNTTLVNNSTKTNASASGTGEAGAAISLVVDDGGKTTSAYTTTVAANGTWAITGIDVSTLDDGVLAYRATATDAAGNTATSSHAGTKDTVAPEVAITAATDPALNSNLTNASASGTGEATASISLVVTDGTHTTTEYTTTVAADHTWSITGIDLSTLSDGPITYRVTATDEAGNTTTTTRNANQDTLVVAITSVTDPVHNSNLTTASASGTGEANASITLFVTDGTHSTSDFTTTVAANGTWSITDIDLTGLDDGTITYMVSSGDTAGNTANDEQTATKDTLVVTITSVSDPVNNDNVTTTAAGGTGEANASITLFVTDGSNSTSDYTTTVGGDGTWNISDIDVTGLGDGTLTYMVSSTDSANNTATDELTTAKDTLVVGIVAVSNPVHNTNAANASASGTGEVDASITLFVTDGVHNTSDYTTTVAANGTWSITDIDLTGLDDGTITYMVSSSDTGGNSASDELDATKDTLVVALTEVTDPVHNSNLTTASASGTGEVDASITLFVTDGVHSTADFTTTVAANGTWSITDIDLTGLDDGTITYMVSSGDIAGNTATDELTADKDTLIVALTEVTDPVHNSNLTTASASGTGEVDASITLFVTDGVHNTSDYTTTVASDGTWSVIEIDLTGLDDGTITYMVSSGDTAGNTATDELTADKDTLVVALTEVTDPVNNDNVTTASASGTGEVDASITLFVTDGVHNTSDYTTTVAANGTWSITDIDLTGLDDSTITYMVSSGDTAGNTATDELTADKDTLIVALTEVTDPVNNDNVTTASASGTGEVDASITLFVADGVHNTPDYTTTVAANGTWSITDIDLTGLDDGTITYMVSSGDTAGNTATDELTADKDTLVVALTEVTDPVTSDNVTTASASGTGEADASITLFVTDGVHNSSDYTTNVAANGTWSITDIDLTGLDDGTITYMVSSGDTAGNTATDALDASKDTAIMEMAAMGDGFGLDSGFRRCRRRFGRRLCQRGRFRVRTGRFVAHRVGHTGHAN